MFNGPITIEFKPNFYELIILYIPIPKMNRFDLYQKPK